MKYVNDPFWIRLRWILFVLFWAAWVAMLAGAILIIVYAPKCSKPTPLQWYKKGPLLTIDDNSGNTEADLKLIKDFGTTGVIYELSDDKTYKVKEAEVEEQIKNIVKKFK